MAKSATRTSMGMNDMAKQIAAGHKRVGIIVAICMVVLGILFTIWPLSVSAIGAWLATIAFIVYGVYQIMVYIRTPHDYKNGWMLANGIIYIILGILLLMEGAAARLETFAFVLGFMAMYSGIMQCASFGALRRADAPGAGWVLVSGILNIILSLFLLMTPFAAVWAMAYVIGIYLIVGGVALFAEACSGHYGMKA
ncbi:MAG: hypothetical protein HDQ87_02950 [Clostridia bacterium]|nr:hypothetical protein [Clostridia bacterium]